MEFPDPSKAIRDARMKRAERYNKLVMDSIHLASQARPLDAAMRLRHELKQLIPREDYAPAQALLLAALWALNEAPSYSVLPLSNQIAALALLSTAQNNISAASVLLAEWPMEHDAISFIARLAGEERLADEIREARFASEVEHLAEGGEK